MSKFDTIQNMLKKKKRTDRLIDRRAGWQRKRDRNIKIEFSILKFSTIQNILKQKKKERLTGRQGGRQKERIEERIKERKKERNKETNEQMNE